MKGILFVLFSIISFYSFGLELKMDTIYYDKAWKGISNPHFASFYRIIEKNPKDEYKKLFRDYFITGELQSEGGYIEINRFDDSKSLMDGEWISYYKSGAVEQKVMLINGKRQGEYVRFLENGNIALRANFFDDELHGLHTEFKENGLCIQKEYWHGGPKYDYYVITNDNGLHSKLRISDDSPIYTTPPLTKKKIEYRDGEEWAYYINDGILIAMTNKEIKDYGKYYRTYINLTNNSFYSIEFDPSEVVATLIDRNDNELPLNIQTAEEYDKKIKRKQMWEEAMVGLANGLATAGAGYSTTTTTSSYSGVSNSYGNAYTYGSSGYSYGSYSGNTNYYGNSISTTRTYDASAAYQAQMVASQNMASFSENNLQAREARNEGYLKRTTILPGESISGYFNIKRKKGNTLIVILNIAGAEYQFPCNVSH